VVDLSDGLGLSRPNTSKHLACLHGCGLVERDPRGREVFYALAEGVPDLLDGVDALLEGSLHVATTLGWDVALMKEVSCGSASTRSSKRRPGGG
jgi:hypothetical protein